MQLIKKISLLSLVLASMLGCAAGNSPQEIDFYSKVWYYSGSCAHAGLMDRDTAAKGMAYASSNIYKSDSAKAEARIKELAGSGIQVNKSECDSLALRVMDEASKPTPATASVSRPTFTNCSTYFGQTFCTSY
jgi:hypothetical protein